MDKENKRNVHIEMPSYNSLKIIHHVINHDFPLCPLCKFCEKKIEEHKTGGDYIFAHW